MAEGAGILGEIVARKRVDVASRLGSIGLGELRARATPSGKSLRRALAQPGARFICEIKRSSPSAGTLAANIDVTRLARQYRGVADALSVLIDTPYFGGSLHDLAQARAAFDGPILAKDFIIDPRQVAEARIRGADAVLVMLSVLSPSEASEIIREADLLGMDALVEVHDQQELDQAIALGAPLIGINNRNLKTLEVDLGTSERLAPLVPSDMTLVAESGISSRSDVRRLAPLVDAFLIGSALMGAERATLKARELAFGRIKICGVTTAADARMAADLGASHIGMVFVPSSPRSISVERAQHIAIEARERGLRTVGIFRRELPLDVSMIVRRLELDAVQLHGDEDAAYVQRLKNFLADRCEVWTARGVDLQAPRPCEGADRNLYDTLANGRCGGTGKCFDWSLLDPALVREGLLAGGLNAANIGEAAATGAWGLDVGSGVETAPGAKCPVKMKSLFAALRPAARSETMSCK